MRVHRSFGIAVLLLCLAACCARLSQENFDKIHEGMSQKEVREILGEPVDASGAILLSPQVFQHVFQYVRADPVTVETKHEGKLNAYRVAGLKTAQ